MPLSHGTLRALLATGAVMALAAPIAFAPPAFATPPDHAPAHGYRAKQGRTPQKSEPERPKGGIEIVYDSDLGIHVGVDLPGVFFYEGRYYRQSGDGRWEVSATGDSGWKISASSGIPKKVVAAKQRQPGPARAADSASKKKQE